MRSGGGSKAWSHNEDIYLLIAILQNANVTIGTQLSSDIGRDLGRTGKAVREHIFKLRKTALNAGVVKGGPIVKSVPRPGARKKIGAIGGGGKKVAGGAGGARGRPRAAKADADGSWNDDDGEGANDEDNGAELAATRARRAANGFDDGDGGVGGMAQVTGSQEDTQDFTHDSAQEAEDAAILGLPGVKRSTKATAARSGNDSDSAVLGKRKLEADDADIPSSPNDTTGGGYLKKPPRHPKFSHKAEPSEKSDDDGDAAGYDTDAEFKIKEEPSEQDGVGVASGSGYGASGSRYGNKRSNGNAYVGGYSGASQYAYANGFDFRKYDYGRFAKSQKLDPVDEDDEADEEEE